MKILTIIIFVLLFTQLTAHSQPCLPQGINFSSQAEVDNFKENYPGCTEIEGSVSFGSWGGANDITNLDGLSEITSIGGSLRFGWIVGTFYGGTDLPNFAGLDSLTSIGGNLRILWHNHLTSLTGLEGLTSIGGGLVITDNDSLTNLNGLENLASIGGKIGIYDNNYLTSLTELNNVASIGGGLEIASNHSLSSLSGLENINAGSIENLYISENSSLSSCEVQSVCDYLAAPNGTVDIFLNASGCNNPGEIALACGYSLPCLPYGNYYVWSQSEVDDFQTNYPGCTELTGYVQISGNDIMDLSELNVVTSIKDDLNIIDLDALTNLTGLQQLTSVGKNLNIEYNEALYSLSGLAGLNHIGQELRINHNKVLSSLVGLENIEAGSIGSLALIYNNSLSTCEVESICDYLANPNGNIAIHENAPGCNNPQEVEELCLFSCLSEGITFNSQSEIDNFQNNYPSCVKIDGDVTINGEDIFNLIGLNSLKSIGGKLEITGNGLLTSLTGLNNINSVGGNLWITNNSAMASLDELINITSIGGSLHIENNTSITNLWGLENIVPASIIELHIIDNTSLAECDLQNVCEYLTIPGATILIYNNAQGCNSQEEVEEACDYHCLSNGITFNTQEKIDNFQYNYPLCNKIDGNVKIIGNNITNLNGLNTLTFIGGNLKIIEAPSLVELTGLNNLVYISGELEIRDNNSLHDLTGLDNLAIIGNGLFVDKNELLSNFFGLENLVSILGDGLAIGTLTPEGGNPSLTNLTGLSNLTFIEGGLFINYNPGLTSLVGLDNLSTIDGGIEIRYNESLSDITALSNINPGSIDSLILRINSLLSDCAIQSICGYLINQNGYAWITNNGTGCNSQEEVEAVCDTVYVSEINFKKAMTIAPNPLESNAVISYTLNESSHITLKILDISGREIIRLVNDVQQQGEQKIDFNTGGLPTGVYFCVLKTNKGIQTAKMIKIE